MTQPTSSVIITDENCEDGTGAIDITIAGGTPPYIISWNNGETTEDLYNLSSGIYNVNIIDDTGCEINGFYNINNVGIPVDLISANVTHATCATCPEGSISLNLDPAGAPFTFSWDNGETTQDITSLVPGFYTVTVTSADGCVDSMTYEVINTASIDENSGLSINISPNPSDGIFDVFIDGLDNVQFNYEIIDATGRVVVNGNEMLDNGSVLIDISKFNTGTYILKLSNEDYLFVERIVLY